MNDPLPAGNLRAMVQVFARAMTPCLVAARPVHLHNRSSVRTLPGTSRPGIKHSQSSWRLQVCWPSGDGRQLVPESTGHVARVPAPRWRREAPGFRHGTCHSRAIVYRHVPPATYCALLIVHTHARHPHARQPSPPSLAPCRSLPLPFTPLLPPSVRPVSMHRPSLRHLVPCP